MKIDKVDHVINITESLKLQKYIPFDWNNSIICCLPFRCVKAIDMQNFNVCEYLNDKNNENPSANVKLNL